MHTSPDSWRSKLRIDPVLALLATDSPALNYFTRRDFSDELVGDIRKLWELPEVARILRQQQTDGSWKYPGRRTDPREDYDQLETYRQFAILIEKYGLDRRHPAIEKAAEFFFSRQADEGDFRGIYVNQYATTYSPAILELLVKAGYVMDQPIERGFEWLLSIRQDDGGWAIPLCTVGMDWRRSFDLPEPLQPDRSKPFSTLVTGIALRAFAAHPGWWSSPETIQAGKLLASRFFKADRYIGRRGKEYWEKACFPFWFTDIVSALDSLARLGFTKDYSAIAPALDWLAAHQRSDGFFELKYIRSGGDHLTPAWVCLAICRIFKGLFD